MSGVGLSDTPESDDAPDPKEIFLKEKEEEMRQLFPHLCPDWINQQVKLVMFLTSIKV